MKNDGLEKALEETWRNKEKFYEDTKGLSMLEIVTGIESKYKERGATSAWAVSPSPSPRFAIIRYYKEE